MPCFIERFCAKQKNVPSLIDEKLVFVYYIVKSITESLRADLKEEAVSCCYRTRLRW